MSEAHTKKVVTVSVAAATHLTPEEVTTRLNNKEKMVPAPTQGPDKTDAETAEYLQREEEVSTAVAEQEEAQK